MSKIDHVFMNTALEFASLSKCVALKVGCVAVKDSRIIATGINGTAPGYYNCNELFDINNFNKEDHHAFSENYEIHAEQNLMMYCAKNGIPLNNATLYCTHHPCWTCLKLLSVVGIKTIYYDTMYNRVSDDAVKINNYIKKVNINIIKLGDY